jgi:subtilisin family serine protease
VTSVGPLGNKSDFANFGWKVDFAAPGESIYSTFPKDGYAYWSGTSMASPFVAGQAALVHSIAPALNPREIAKVIYESSHSLDSINSQFDDHHDDDDDSGIGLVDVKNSLELALGLGNGQNTDDHDLRWRVQESNRGLIGWSCINN